MSDLANLIETLQANDTDIRVVVFSSANKEFFIAHLDIEYFLPGYESPLPQFDPGFPDMVFPEALIWNITQLPQATIAHIEGRARGIGSEFLLACDMRFATTSTSELLAQLETSLGLNPGAGGAMYLAPLIGRGLTSSTCCPPRTSTRARQRASDGSTARSTPRRSCMITSRRSPRGLHCSPLRRSRARRRGSTR
ncbi:ClpP/crotonase-like domain-containing protein [Mycena capillaripes]|nr:ClpP/crotonase-like domain-containing protein [Mycena capillaripes]